MFGRGRPRPEELVGTLHPTSEALLKREEHTLVWRESRPEEEPVVVKMYRDRGLWNHLRGRAIRFRTEREFLRLRHLEAVGIPCTPPLGWAAGHSPEHGCHEILVMREVPNAVQLQDVLRGEVGMDLGPLFGIVRRMHECGFCHQTLFPTNILVRRGEPAESAYVISDVPRSWVFPGSIVGTCMARDDLRDLVFCLEREGVARSDIPVDAYGPVRDGKAPIPPRFEGTDSRTKWQRQKRDVVARVRWATAWVGCFLPGPFPTQ